MLVISPANDHKFIRSLPTLEAEIGEKAARLLLQIEYWIRISTTEERDGKKWTYQSTRDIQTNAFPGWALATINRAIKKLTDLELIEVSNFNVAKYDFTRWFALNPVGISRLKSIVLTQNDTGSDQNDTRSTQDDTRSNQDDTRSAQKGTTIPETSSETSSLISSETPAAKRADAAANFPNPAISEKVLVGNPMPPAKADDIEKSPQQPAKPITPPVPVHPPIDWLAEECAEDPPDDLKQFFSAAKAGELEAMMKRHGVDHIREMIESVRLLPNIDNPPGLVVSKLRMEALTTWQWPKRMTDDGKKYITGKYAEFIQH